MARRTTTAYGALGGGATVNANTATATQASSARRSTPSRSGDPAAATTIGLNGTTDQFVLAAGGILINDSGNQAIAIQGGSITAGALNTASTLYLQVGTQNTLTINSPFVNNGATLSSTTGPGPAAPAPVDPRSTGNLTVTFDAAASRKLGRTLGTTGHRSECAPAFIVGMAVSGGR